MLALQTLHDGVNESIIRAGVNSANLLAGMHETNNVALMQMANVIGMLHAINAATPGTNATCTDPFVTTLKGGLSTIINILMALGVAIAVIGIVVGGLMRATAWGSEQRIATSNKAITCAVIGLVIVLIGVTLGNSIPGWFTGTGGSCAVGS